MRRGLFNGLCALLVSIREKAMTDARRLTQLQKQRELRAAGLNDRTGLDIRPRRGKKKRDYINYATETPFETAPLPGLHTVGAEERPKPDLDLQRTTLQQLEDRNRWEEEKRNRRDDEKKMKRLREANLPEYLEKQAEQAKQAAAVKRNTLMSLPTPQLGDDDLARLVELGRTGDLGAATGMLTSSQAGGAGGAGFTTITSVTTSHANKRSKGEVIFEEARNLAKLRSMQTPLSGEENADIEGDLEFNQLLPQKLAQSARTPNLYSEALSNTPYMTGKPQLALASGSAISSTSRVKAVLESLPAAENEVVLDHSALLNEMRDEQQKGSGDVVKVVIHFSFCNSLPSSGR